jgi:hypothetical protein
VRILSEEGKFPPVLTPEFLIPASATTERAQPGDKLLKVDGTAAVLVKDGNHATRERVGRDLGDLEELVFVDRTAAVLVEFAEPFQEAFDLGLRDCEGCGVGSPRRKERKGQRGVVALCIRSDGETGTHSLSFAACFARSDSDLPPSRRWNESGGCDETKGRERWSEAERARAGASAGRKGGRKGV